MYWIRLENDDPIHVIHQRTGTCVSSWIHSLGDMKHMKGCGSISDRKTVTVLDFSFTEWQLITVEIYTFLRGERTSFLYMQRGCSSEVRVKDRPWKIFSFLIWISLTLVFYLLEWFTGKMGFSLGCEELVFQWPWFFVIFMNANGLNLKFMKQERDF